MPEHLLAKEETEGKTIALSTERTPTSTRDKSLGLCLGNRSTWSSISYTDDLLVLPLDHGRLLQKEIFDLYVYLTTRRCGRSNEPKEKPNSKTIAYRAERTLPSTCCKSLGLEHRRRLDWPSISVADDLLVLPLDRWRLLSGPELCLYMDHHPAKHSLCERLWARKVFWYWYILTDWWYRDIVSLHNTNSLR